MSLKTGDVGHLSTCLLAARMSSLVSRLFRCFARYFNGVFCFSSLLSFKSPLSEALWMLSLSVA